MPPHHEVDIWSIEGRFAHLIYSPRGGIEGFLLDTDGIATQFVVDAKDRATTQRLVALVPGQALTVEGSLSAPSPHGEAVHTVYDMHRLHSVDGSPVDRGENEMRVVGTVVRFNYARHGEPNGVVLDSGDFVHLRPDGFSLLDLAVGDRVEAEGRAVALAHDAGHAVEARRVNGRSIRPAD